MANPNQIIPDLNALVKQYRTLKSSQGYTFDYRDDVWKLKKGQIRFDTFLEHATPDFIDQLKDIFAQIINDKTVSDGTVITITKHYCISLDLSMKNLMSWLMISMIPL